MFSNTFNKIKITRIYKNLLFKKNYSKNMEGLKLNNLKNEMYEKLKSQMTELKKDKMYINLPENFFIKTNFEKEFPLIYGGLKHRFRINTDFIEANIFNLSMLEKYKEYNKTNINENNNANISINENKINEKDFLESLIQLKLPVLREEDRNFLFNHVIELIDIIAAETVYRHSTGSFKMNSDYQFVTVLFNNLKIYNKSDVAHEFNFSLDKTKPLIINSYIVYAGNTSYMLKLDYFQNNGLIFDIYSTFVNLNKLTFKPQEVPGISNYTENKEYKKIYILSSVLKQVQNLFSHNGVINKVLHEDDINFVNNYFKNIEIKKINLGKNHNNLSDIEEKQENILSLVDIINKNNISFYISTNNYLCKDSYIESIYFITSEFKNIHNFTFGGYLAYLSFCHALTITKHFLKFPILIGINEIQYILPVPYNAQILYKGKIVYSDEKQIYVKIFAYIYDVKKQINHLCTIFDLSFCNNENISFIPQSTEEIKWYLLSYIRSQLLQ